MTFSLVGGALPPGITINSDGSFSGTTNVLGTFTFTIEVCDSSAPPACSFVILSLVIQPLPFTGLSFLWWALAALAMMAAGAHLQIERDRRVV